MPFKTKVGSEFCALSVNTASGGHLPLEGTAVRHSRSLSKAPLVRVSLYKSALCNDDICLLTMQYHVATPENPPAG